MLNSKTPPFLILMLGLPGAGKSYFARQFVLKHEFGYVSDDLIRYQLYDDPQYSDAENALVLRLQDIMASELLRTGSSVIYDGNLYSRNMRNQRARLARKFSAQTLTVWVQTDLETSFYRATHRDRRRPDDKFTVNINRQIFERAMRLFSRPDREDYSVISGKHPFSAQEATVLRKLAALGHDVGLKLPATPTAPKKSMPPRYDPKRREVPRSQ